MPKTHDSVNDAVEPFLAVEAFVEAKNEQTSFTITRTAKEDNEFFRDGETGLLVEVIDRSVCFSIEFQGIARPSN
jgi:hypothetical protein